MMTTNENTVGYCQKKNDKRITRNKLKKCCWMRQNGRCSYLKFPYKWQPEDIAAS